jgi:serine/threonine protein kinase
MKYPLRSEYETAIRYLDKFIFDVSLKGGKPVTQPQNPNVLRSYNGGKAVVYEIATKAQKYALKCWVEDLGDLKFRYKEIDSYLRSVSVPYFVDFAYSEQGILVNGTKFPIVRMEWVEGISFKKFISNNINTPIHIRNLAEQFLEMVQTLHQKQISHGDLQHGNIMVRQNGKICLVDYDSLFVPKLANEKDSIKGLPGYQHPKRNAIDKLSPKADYFSELVIYLSLLVIAEKPSYWKQIENEERLLFSENDLLKYQQSTIFKGLKSLSPEVQYFTTELEKFCAEIKIDNLRPLEDLVNAYSGKKTIWDSSNLPTQPVTTVQNVIITVSGIDSWDTFKPNNANNIQTPIQQVTVNSTNSWDKLDTKKNNNDVWDKLNISKPQKISTSAQQLKNQPQTVVTGDNFWNKLNRKTSSIWDKIVSWFKSLSATKE